MIPERLYQKMISANMPCRFIQKVIQSDSEGQLDLNWLSTLTEQILKVNKAHKTLTEPSFMNGLTIQINYYKRPITFTQQSLESGSGKQ